MSEPIFAVAIPAFNEAERIGRCLDSLAAQQNAGAFVVVVLANNCTDDTAAIARRPRSLAVEVIEHDFATGDRHAGTARRMAVAHAATLGTVILTTDADCVADRDWVRAHRAAFAHGVDAVAGRVSADWSELSRQSAETLQIGMGESQYADLIARAEAMFDPEPHDPLPRHAQRCGANIGITRAMLDRVGGVPAIPTSEDRALLAAVERADGRIRHDPAPHVVASARLVGRATGGMADTLRERLASGGAYLCDEQMWPADTLVAMWRARREARDRADANAFGAVRAALAERYRPKARLCPADIPAQMTRMLEWIEAHE